MGIVENAVKVVNKQAVLQEWDGNIHDAQTVHGFGERMYDDLNQNGKSEYRLWHRSPENYDPDNIYHAIPTKNLYDALARGAAKGRYYDPEKPEDVAKLGSISRLGWARAVAQETPEGLAKEKIFSNGYKLSRGKNAALAFQDPDPAYLKSHLITNGVPEEEAHAYSLPYDQAYGIAAAKVFNKGRQG